MGKLPPREISRLVRPLVHIRKPAREHAVRHVERLVSVGPDRAIDRPFRRARRGATGQCPARVGSDSVEIMCWDLVQVDALSGRQVLDDGRTGVGGVKVRLEKRFVESEDQLEFDGEGEGEVDVGHDCGCG